MTKENANELCSVCEETLKEMNSWIPGSPLFEMYCDHEKENTEEVTYFLVRHAKHN